MEYSWDKPTHPKTEQVKTETIIKTENESDAVTEKPESDLEDEKPPNDLNLSLQRLLSVAKLHYRKNMIKCPCGHVCGGPSKNAQSQKQKGGGSRKNADSGMCDKSTQSPEVSEVFGNLTAT